MSWRVAHAKFLEPTVEIRGNPPFAKKKRRIGPPPLWDWSSFQKSRVRHPPQLLRLIAILMTGHLPCTLFVASDAD
jgi:hypothetical protein